MPNKRHLEQGKVRTYAQVLLDNVFATGGESAAVNVCDELETVVASFRSNVNLTIALHDVTSAPDVRATIARNTFATCTPALTETLAVMAQRGDVELVSKVYASYVEQLEQKLGVVLVEVTTTVPLNDHLREVITNKLQVDLNSKVVLREHIDKKLLGGILLTAGGKRIDASVASKLEAVRTALTQTTDGGECS